CHKYSNTPFTF
nr:immunoglobulin light chain junction region [Macaca mulatta]